MGPSSHHDVLQNKLYDSVKQISWFAAACWNLALQPEVNVQQQFKLLWFSWWLAVEDPARALMTQGRRKTTTVVALLSGISASRQASDPETRLAIFRWACDPIRLGKLRETFTRRKMHKSTGGGCRLAFFAFLCVREHS